MASILAVPRLASDHVLSTDLYCFVSKSRSIHFFQVFEGTLTDHQFVISSEYPDTSAAQGLDIFRVGNKADDCHPGFRYLRRRDASLAGLCPQGCPEGSLLAAGKVRDFLPFVHIVQLLAIIFHPGR